MTAKPATSTGTGPRTSPRLGDETRFVTAGGLAAIVSMGLLVAGIVMHVRYGGSPPDGMATYLADVNANRTGNFLVTSVQLGSRLVLLVFFVALYQLFREVGSVARLGAVAGVAGLLVISGTHVLHAGITELAGHYVVADAAARPAIAATAEAMLQMIAVLDLAGHLLAWGVGGSLFSLAILRTGVVSRWLGWGGVVYGVAVWATVVEVAALPGVTARDSVIFLLGLLYGILWVLAVGVALLRLDAAEIP